MISEIRELCKQGKKYFTHFWSFVEWLIIIFSWAAVAMYAYRIYASIEISNFFKKTSGYGYYKLQYVTLWNESLRYCLAFCACLGTLKFLKLLRFDKRVSFLSSTIQYASKQLIAFGFMFFILWCAFVQLMYIFFQDKILGFSTFLRSMTTCFQIMLGKFQVNPLLQANPLFGPIIFSIYNIFIVFILLNMFISIINDAFSAIRSSNANYSDDYQMFNFIYNKMRLLFGLGSDKLNRNSVLDGNNNRYKEENLPDKVDNLLDAFTDVSKSNLFIFVYFLNFNFS